MQIACTPEELDLFRIISRAADKLGFPAYLIGGFVRDKIIGRPTKDADIVCLGDGIALAQEVAKAFHPKPAVSFFRNFGTAQVKLPGYELEFVGARKESYRTDSRKPEVEPGSLEDDQNRRDFTINAMAISLNATTFGQLLDPFNGREAIENRCIQTPLAPVQTFSDDPLRMMRAIRFAAQLDFQIHPLTFEAICENAGRIRIVSQERITDELNKVMLTAKPSVGWDLLFRSGLLQQVFPQMSDLYGAEYQDGKGHKDNFYHTLQVLDNLSANTNDLWLRWAAVLHDIG
ncbi:MAG TPA: hypothetical protein VG842_01985, partial [Sediminibacterium sp.]|nr:hypothetical protein [Sediminibacterium sp.]